MSDVDKAPHTDVEMLAARLDEMSAAARKVGVQMHRVEQASEMLRHLSRRLYGEERARRSSESPAP